MHHRDSFKAKYEHCIGRFWDVFSAMYDANKRLEAGNVYGLRALELISQQTSDPNILELCKKGREIISSCRASADSAGEAASKALEAGDGN